ncbi:MAG: biotin--[acetyl-CoA-carboxylase] ligase [Peptoniphilaceae bacterium]|nr:biotin--[acetyl-CoA-carboxylase] ligase [Peptoniphilaceae bacterium]
MSTKDKVLEALERHRDVFLSGEQLAALSDVSRASIWKAMNALREAGYPIEAVSRKGYRLMPASDIVSAQGIEKYAAFQKTPWQIHVTPSAPSTNDALREAAQQGAPEGLVLIAREQTAGRGRRGRSFHSPADTGIYMSLLLRPQHITPQQATRVTTMAAVALSESIEETTGEPAAIKWVNDIFMHGKKVAGILTECALDLETGLLDYVILGLGINVYPPRDGFPPDLVSIATSISTQRGDDLKNRLVAAFLQHFYEDYAEACPCDSERGKSSGTRPSYVDRYRARCFIIGETVDLVGAEGIKTVFVHDVDDDCRLVVEDEDGQIQHLLGGEIHIRMLSSDAEPVFRGRVNKAE